MCIYVHIMFMYTYIHMHMHIHIYVQRYVCVYADVFLRVCCNLLLLLVASRTRLLYPTLTADNASSLFWAKPADPHWAADRPRYDRVCYFGCLRRGSKSVQVLFNGKEAVMVLISIILK